MQHKQSLLSSLILVCLSAPVHAQPWAGILDPARAIDWSKVGIPGGIPSGTWAQCGSTIQASTYGNGSNDASGGIQTALNGCASNHYVLLSAGTFRLNSSLSIPSNVVLRGSGASSTVLNLHVTSTPAINLGTGSVGTTLVSITGGATAGSQSITVSSASGITVGSYLLVTELNNSGAPFYVSNVGTEGTCGWCDQWGGTRARGQVVEVTTVNGTQIGISPGLYSAYTLTPSVTPFPASAKYAGVENLQTYANNAYTGRSGATMWMRNCAYCWVKGVMNNFTDADHVRADFSYRGEIRDSYFEDAYYHTSGNSDSDVFIVNKSSGFLVENNILDRLHTSIMLNWGAAGNVIAYNYALRNYDSGSLNYVPLAINAHGANPQFNLWEGNVGPNLTPDSIWGSSSVNTSFRNWWVGTSQVCSPTNSTRGVINCSGSNGHWAYQYARAIDLGYEARTYNLVGDVAGSVESRAANNGHETAQIVPPQAASYDGVSYDSAFGYYGAGNSSSDSTLPYTTAFLHGVYRYADGSTVWNSGNSNHTLPASFFLTSKPGWWGSLPWPSIGPDVTGGTGPGGHTSTTASNPAQACYNNTPTDSNGMLIFDAATCYGQAGSPPAPPTAFTAVAH